MKTIDQMLVTPDMAKKWLEKNRNNRRVRMSAVRRYSDTMSRGLWGFNHQGYLLGADGSLIDGQHRAIAQVASGVSIRVNVTFLEQGDPLYEPLDGHIDENVKRNDSDVTRLSPRAVAVVRAFPALGRVYLGKTRRQLTPRELLALNDVISCVMEIRSKGKRGLTAMAQAIFVCAAYDLSDTAIETQWGLLGTEAEEPGRWPMVVRVFRETNNTAIAAASRFGRSPIGGNSVWTERVVALWWISLQPKMRNRIDLRGTAPMIGRARDEVAGVAKAIMEAAGIDVGEKPI